MATEFREMRGRLTTSAATIFVLSGLGVGGVLLADEVRTTDQLKQFYKDFEAYLKLLGPAGLSGLFAFVLVRLGIHNIVDRLIFRARPGIDKEIRSSISRPCQSFGCGIWQTKDQATGALMRIFYRFVNPDQGKVSAVLYSQAFDHWTDYYVGLYAATAGGLGAPAALLLIFLLDGASRWQSHAGFIWLLLILAVGLVLSQVTARRRAYAIMQQQSQTIQEKFSHELDQELRASLCSREPRCQR